MSQDKRIDTRTTEEINIAQRGLLKIIGVATIIPVIWVVLLAWNGYQHMDSAPYGDVGFAKFVVAWGLLAPVVWVGCYGYVIFQMTRGNMDAGRFLPVLPALWIIFWFGVQFVRQSDWFM